MIDRKRSHAIIFAILAVFLLAAIQTVKFRMAAEDNEGKFIGTDTYMRMVRARELYDGGDWYDTTIERSNYPYGDELHWTRPMDLLIIGEARLIEPLAGRERAFELSGLSVSLIIGGLSVLAMLWASSRIFEWGIVPISIILFLSQYFVLQYFSIGRPDHHSLIILLFILFYACALRLLSGEKSRTWAFACAAAAATAFWVSVETVILPAMLALVLTLVWLFRGDDSMDKLGGFSLALAALTGTFILVERPLSNLMAEEYDKISFPYLLLFVALALFSFGARRLKDSNMKARIIYSVSSGAGLLFALAWLYPQLVKGPFSGVNPAIVPLWLSRVEEVQSIFAVETGEALLYLGLPILGAMGLACFFIRGQIKRPAEWGLIALGLIAYIALGIYQIRWVAYAQILAVFPATLIVKRAFTRIGKWKSKKLQAVARCVTVFMLCLSFIGLDLLLIEEESHASGQDEESSSLKEVCEWMDLRYAGEEHVVLAHVNYGPQILYRTKMNVIATPYHRNDGGILFYHNTMAERDMEKAETMMKSRFVKIILLDETLYYNENEIGADALRNRLIEGNAPDWISEIRLPEEIRGYRIYETAF